MAWGPAKSKHGGKLDLNDLVNPAAPFVIVLTATGALAARTDAAAVRLPWNAVLEQISMTVQSLGGTGLQTAVDVNIATAPGSARATILTAPMSLAYDSAAGWVTQTPSGGNYAVSSGMILAIDIDSVPTAASAGLTVSIFGHKTHVTS